MKKLGILRGIKSDPKYAEWEDIALKYLARYHELVEKEKELLAKIEAQKFLFERSKRFS